VTLHLVRHGRPPVDRWAALGLPDVIDVESV
jgi:hypothetical protein